VSAGLDEHFMRAALVEARKGIGQTSPNPAVGAVLVAADQIIARGYHRAAGLPHAEVECLQNARGGIPKDATLYVTLEPCSTQGRTPACTAAILEAGIRNVVIGATDVNPRHAGSGMKVLQHAGVTVRSGVLADECAAINEAFEKWIQTKRPLVIAKCGMSLDGRLTRPPGEERWLTSGAARKHANRLRSEVDAIVVGAESVRADNPRLTVREIKDARQPWRVVLTRSGHLPKDAHLFTDRFADRTLVFRDQPLADVLEELGAKEITSVLIEGGGDVLGQALDARLIDRVHIYLAPLFTGGPQIAYPGEGAGSTRRVFSLQECDTSESGRIFSSPERQHIELRLPNNILKPFVFVRVQSPHNLRRNTE
jgi:diaminohydroxyphosphoribosylaminopyrimidine deaminase/5-amino-6-(5-phosphoribosylamino)uracil reductase